MKPRFAFTLIELLVAVAIIGILLSILLPTLSAARRQARASVCATRLRTLGQGWHMYAMENSDIAPPGRWPGGTVAVAGGRKYRPRWVAVMGSMVGEQPFRQPLPTAAETDLDGQAGDRQDYASPVYVCPEADWRDERNHAYGYNYQFLGNSRLAPDGRYLNFPVLTARLRSPSGVVLAADCMGTAASFTRAERRSYENNSRDEDRLGNEGWPLDPPRLNIERASDGHRSAVDPRHAGRAATIWADGHAKARTPEQLGYTLAADGRFEDEGDNRLWSPRAIDELPP